MKTLFAIWAMILVGCEAPSIDEYVSFSDETETNIKDTGSTESTDSMEVETPTNPEEINTGINTEGTEESDSISSDSTDSISENTDNIDTDSDTETLSEIDTTIESESDSESESETETESNSDEEDDSDTESETTEQDSTTLYEDTDTNSDAEDTMDTMDTVDTETTTEECTYICALDVVCQAWGGSIVPGVCSDNVLSCCYLDLPSDSDTGTQSGGDSDADSDSDGDIDTETDTESAMAGPIRCNTDNSLQQCGDVDLCVDGFCCNTTCQGTCESCSVLGFEGICTPHLAGTDPESNCGGCETCDGFGECKAIEYGKDSKDFCINEGSCGKTGFCDGLGACEVAFQGIACNDGNPCTYEDKCDGLGSCKGKEIECESEPDACGIKRTCNGTNECEESYPIGNPCNDGDLCTYGDICDGNGACVGNEIICEDDEEFCGANKSCNGTDRCSVSYPIGQECEDDDPCTIGETCVKGGTCGERKCYYDEATSLYWELPTHYHLDTWSQAKGRCLGLTIGEFSEWRMPLLPELINFIRGCSDVEECPAGTSGHNTTDVLDLPECSGFCYPDEGPGIGGCYMDAHMDVECKEYWAGTAPADDFNNPWFVNFKSAQIKNGSGFRDVLCVHSN